MRVVLNLHQFFFQQIKAITEIQDWSKWRLSDYRVPPQPQPEHPLCNPQHLVLREHGRRGGNTVRTRGPGCLLLHNIL